MENVIQRAQASLRMFLLSSLSQGLQSRVFQTAYAEATAELDKAAAHMGDAEIVEHALLAVKRCGELLNEEGAGKTLAERLSALGDRLAKVAAGASGLKGEGVAQVKGNAESAHAALVQSINALGSWRSSIGVTRSEAWARANNSAKAAAQRTQRAEERLQKASTLACEQLAQTWRDCRGALEHASSRRQKLASGSKPRAVQRIAIHTSFAGSAESTRARECAHKLKMSKQAVDKAMRSESEACNVVHAATSSRIRAGHGPVSSAEVASRKALAKTVGQLESDVRAAIAAISAAEEAVERACGMVDQEDLQRALREVADDTVDGERDAAFTMDAAKAAEARAASAGGKDGEGSTVDWNTWVSAIETHFAPDDDAKADAKADAKENPSSTGTPALNKSDAASRAREGASKLAHVMSSGKHTFTAAAAASAPSSSSSSSSSAVEEARDAHHDMALVRLDARLERIEERRRLLHTEALFGLRLDLEGGGTAASVRKGADDAEEREDVRFIGTRLRVADSALEEARRQRMRAASMGAGASTLKGRQGRNAAVAAAAAAGNKAAAVAKAHGALTTAEESLNEAHARMHLAEQRRVARPGLEAQIKETHREAMLRRLARERKAAEAARTQREEELQKLTPLISRLAVVSAMVSAHPPSDSSDGGGNVGNGVGVAAKFAHPELVARDLVAAQGAVSIAVDAAASLEPVPPDTGTGSAKEIRGQTMLEAAVHDANVKVTALEARVKAERAEWEMAQSEEASKLASSRRLETATASLRNLLERIGRGNDVDTWGTADGSPAGGRSPTGGASWAMGTRLAVGAALGSALRTAKVQVELAQDALDGTPGAAYRYGNGNVAGGFTSMDAASIERLVERAEEAVRAAGSIVQHSEDVHQLTTKLQRTVSTHRRLLEVSERQLVECKAAHTVLQHGGIRLRVDLRPCEADYHVFGIVGKRSVSGTPTSSSSSSSSSGGGGSSGRRRRAEKKATRFEAPRPGVLASVAAVAQATGLVPADFKGHSRPEQAAQMCHVTITVVPVQVPGGGESGNRKKMDGSSSSSSVVVEVALSEVRGAEQRLLLAQGTAMHAATEAEGGIWALHDALGGSQQSSTPRGNASGTSERSLARFKTTLESFKAVLAAEQRRAAVLLRRRIHAAESAVQRQGAAGAEGADAKSMRASMLAHIKKRMASEQARGSPRPSPREATSPSRYARTAAADAAAALAESGHPDEAKPWQPDQGDDKEESVAQELVGTDEDGEEEEEEDDDDDDEVEDRGALEQRQLELEIRAGVARSVAMRQKQKRLNGPLEEGQGQSPKMSTSPKGFVFDQTASPSASSSEAPLGQGAAAAVMRAVKARVRAQCKAYKAAVLDSVDKLPGSEPAATPSASRAGDENKRTSSKMELKAAEPRTKRGTGKKKGGAKARLDPSVHAATHVDTNLYVAEEDKLLPHSASWIRGLHDDGQLLTGVQRKAFKSGAQGHDASHELTADILVKVRAKLKQASYVYTPGQKKGGQNFATIFGALDKNHDGTLDIVEFASGLRRRVNITDDDVQCLSLWFDRNGDGVVDYSEFQAFLASDKQRDIGRLARLSRQRRRLSGVAGTSGAAPSAGTKKTRTPNKGHKAKVSRTRDRARTQTQTRTRTRRGMGRKKGSATARKARLDPSVYAATHTDTNLFVAESGKLLKRSASWIAGLHDDGKHLTGMQRKSFKPGAQGHSDNHELTAATLAKVRAKLKQASYVYTAGHEEGGQNLRTIFDAMDKNHDGTVDMVEFVSGLRRRVNVTDDDVRHLSLWFDRNGDGLVDHTEFQAFLDSDEQRDIGRLTRLSRQRRRLSSTMSNAATVRRGKSTGKAQLKRATETPQMRGRGSKNGEGRKTYGPQNSVRRARARRRGQMQPDETLRVEPYDEKPERWFDNSLRSGGGSSTTRKSTAAGDRMKGLRKKNTSKKRFVVSSFASRRNIAENR